MRSVSQIYSEAVIARNNYLQLTELDSGRTKSKMSILNLFTYVMAVCIHTYEAVLDAFEVRIASVISKRINGTPDWYATMAKFFQYNAISGTGDELVFDEDTLKIKYVTLDISHRIIERSAWQDSGDGHSITLKVAKANADDNEVQNGTPFSPLSESELIAFRNYIAAIKFIGADIWCESVPGDIITIVADSSNPIYYNDMYVTSEQALDNIKNAMIKYATDYEFNGTLYYQHIIDVIRKADNIAEIGNNIRVYVTSWNTSTGEYDEPFELKGRTVLKSGYIKLLGANGVSTINIDNITLIASSTIM